MNMMPFDEIDEDRYWEIVELLAAVPRPAANEPGGPSLFDDGYFAVLLSEEGRAE